MASILSARSGLAGSRLATTPRSARVARRAVAVKAATGPDYYKQYRIPEDAVATIMGIAGWMVPASSPAPAFGGNSLLGVFNESIAQELAHFPTGPALTSPFWLYLITFHVGLFACMFWGCIGVQARKQGYFD